MTGKFSWRDGRRVRCMVVLMAALALLACSRTVTVKVPPRVDLKGFATIGVVDFAARPPGELAGEATQRLLGQLQAAQPGARFLELGSREQVLREVGRSELDYRAVRAIGERYGVAAVLSGSVEVSEPRPDLALSPNLASVSAQAKIDGKMSAKLWESASGATVWTNSSWGSWSVGRVSIAGNGAASADFRHPQEQSNEIVMALIKALCGDFWPTYERRQASE